LGDVNFFFLYIAIIMTGEKLRLNVPRMPQMAEIHQNSFGGRAPPEPAEGAYSAPPDPLAGFGGEGGMGLGGRGRDGKEGRGDWEGRDRPAHFLVASAAHDRNFMSHGTSVPTFATSCHRERKCIYIQLYSPEYTLAENININDNKQNI